MVKYCFLKGRGSKVLHKELVSRLQDKAISLCTVKNWLKRFKYGDLSCGGEEWTGRLLISLGRALQRFLKKFHFSSVRVMTEQFSVDRAPIKSILDRELVFQSLLTIPANLVEKNFQGIITESRKNSQSDSWNHGVTSLSKTFKITSSRGWSD
jgi:hypothetical protein